MYRANGAGGVLREKVGGWGGVRAAAGIVQAGGDGYRNTAKKRSEEMTQPVRVLHIITRIANGGAEENTLYTVNGLDKRRFAVDLATGGEREAGSLDRIPLDPAVRLHQVPALGRNPDPRRELRALSQIRAVIRQGRYRIVHTHGAKAGILGRAAARREGVAVIINGIHGITFADTMNPVMRLLYRMLERRVGRYTTAFVSVGEDIKNKYHAARIGRPEQYRVIYSGMDLSEFHEAARMDEPARQAVRAELGLSQDDLVVGTVSRFEPRKGHRYLIEAAARLADTFPRLRVLLVGDGPIMEEVAALAREAGIADRTVMTGFRTDVARMFAAMDVHVLTSLWEGLPRVLVQAAAVGRPSVTFACDGAHEIVDDGMNGFVVEMKNVAQLTDRLRVLLTDPETRERMGAAARRKVDDRWDRQEMVRRIENLYEDLLRSAEGAR